MSDYQKARLLLDVSTSLKEAMSTYPDFLAKYQSLPKEAADFYDHIADSLTGADQYALLNIINKYCQLYDDHFLLYQKISAMQVDVNNKALSITDQFRR